MLGGGSLHSLGDILSSFRRPCGRLLQPRIVASAQGSDCAGPMKGCRLGYVGRTAQRGWKGEGDLCQELDNPGEGNRGGGRHSMGVRRDHLLYSVTVAVSSLVSVRYSVKRPFWPGSTDAPGLLEPMLVSSPKPGITKSCFARVSYTRTLRISASQNGTSQNAIFLRCLRRS